MSASEEVEGGAVGGVECDDDIASKVEAEDQEKKVYVGNLSYDIDEATVKESFEQFGTVSEVILPLKRGSGKIRGFGYVTMSTVSEAQKAIDGLNETELLGRTVYVSAADQSPPKKHQVKEKSPTNGTELYVGNVSFDTTIDDISDYFKNYGTVLDCSMPKFRDSGRPRGFAFVTMPDEEALYAIEQTDGQEFHGRNLKVNKSSTSAKNVKLFVGNLSFDTEQSTIEGLFTDIGNVIDFYMPQDKTTGKPRGFAFVTMSGDCAAKAIEDLNGYELDGRTLRVNEAQPKGRGYNGGRY